MKEQLREIGFSNNEIKVYEALLKSYESSAHELITKTKLHKGVVYDNIDRLIEKGLITFILKDNKRSFSIAPPEALTNYIEEEEKAFKKKKKSIEELKEEIEKITFESQEKQEATIYKGIKAIKSFYNETLNNGDYYVFGGPKESVDIMGDLFWEAHHLKRRKNKTNTYILLNQSLKKWGEEQKGTYTHIKYFSKDFEPLTETHIQDNFVAIIVWTEEPILFRINSKKVHDSYKQYFDKMWKTIKS